MISPSIGAGTGGELIAPEVQPANTFFSALAVPYAVYPSVRFELRAWTAKYDTNPDRAPVREWFPLTTVGLIAAAEW